MATTSSPFFWTYCFKESPDISRAALLLLRLPAPCLCVIERHMLNGLDPEWTKSLMSKGLKSDFGIADTRGESSVVARSIPRCAAVAEVEPLTDYW